MAEEQVWSMDSRLPRRRAVFAWDMHYRCNFHCGYCFYTTAGWDELAKKNRYETPEKWEEVWSRIAKKYGRCQLRVTAGEPFTYPRFAEVVARVSKLHDLQITSNLSVTEEIRSFARAADPKAVELDCTFHPTGMAWEPFLANVLLLRAAGFVANVCYLAYPAQLDGMAEFKRRFAAQGVRMNLAVYWGMYEGRQYPFAYTPEQRRLLAEVVGSAESPELVNLEPIPINGKVCGSGQRYAVVQADGKVYRCGQLCEAPHCLGSIFDPDFSLHAEARPCVVDYCRCKEYQSAWAETDSELMDRKGKVAP